MTRGRLPQRAGLPSLNGGGPAAAVPPLRDTERRPLHIAVLRNCGTSYIVIVKA